MAERILRKCINSFTEATTECLAERLWGRRIFILIIFNLACFQPSKTITVIDTGNMYEFHLNSKEGKLIYFVNNVDKTIEIDNEKVFYINNEIFSTFHIYEEAVGTSQDFIFRPSDSNAFITDVYDKSALGDSLILNSINFKDLTGKVRGQDKKYYLINLTLIKY